MVLTSCSSKHLACNNKHCPGAPSYTLCLPDLRCTLTLACLNADCSSHPQPEPHLPSL